MDEDDICEPDARSPPQGGATHPLPNHFYHPRGDLRDEHIVHRNAGRSNDRMAVDKECGKYGDGSRHLPGTAIPRGQDHRVVPDRQLRRDRLCRGFLRHPPCSRCLERYPLGGDVRVRRGRDVRRMGERKEPWNHRDDLRSITHHPDLPDRTAEICGDVAQ